MYNLIRSGVFHNIDFLSIKSNTNYTFRFSRRADSESKQALREVGAVTALMVAAMEGKKESTLKSILSALWNLSAHCSMNKVIFIEEMN